MGVALVSLDVSGGRDLRIPNSVPYRGSQAGWLARLTTTTNNKGTLIFWYTAVTLKRGTTVSRKVKNDFKKFDLVANLGILKSLQLPTVCGFIHFSF